MNLHQLTQALDPVMEHLLARRSQVDASAAILGLQLATNVATAGGLGYLGLREMLAAVKRRAITESQHQRILSAAAREGAEALLNEAFATIRI